MTPRRQRLAQRRRTIGFTQESLADKLGVDRATVVRWERGDNGPQPWVRPRLAHVLRISVEQLADLLTESGGEQPDIRRHSRCADLPGDEEVGTAKRRAVVVAGLASLSLGLVERTSTRACAHVSAALATDLQAVSVSYRRAYRTAPARRLLSTAHEHLELVLALRPGDQAPDVRAQLLVTAGEMAVLSAAVLGLDLGRWSQVGPYLDLAHRAAIETAHLELRTVVLAGRAFHAAYGLGDRQLALDFAEAAVSASRHGVCNTTCGWVAAVASERYADLGNAIASHRRLDSARSALSGVPDTSAWSGIGAFDFAKLTAYEGGNYRRLGDYDNAVRVLDSALTVLDPSMCRHRATALIDRAEAHHGAGQVEAACADTRAALVLVADTQHADTLGRAEKVARSILATDAKEADELWTYVLTLKAKTMAGNA